MKVKSVLTAPTEQGGPEETISAVISLVKDAAAAHLNSEFNSCLSKIRKLLTASPQPAEQKTAPDVAELVEALGWLRGAINCTPENDKHRSGTWISTGHPRIKQIDTILAAHRKGDQP